MQQGLAAARSLTVPRVRCQATAASATPQAATAPAHFSLPGGESLAVPPAVAPLFSPTSLGRLSLSNRIVYAPLTRCRSEGNVPQPVAAEYYGQRAVAGGLIISEAAAISASARGYPATPGLYAAEQLAGWRPVTAAVRDRGGVSFAQLWHCGRASHADYQPDGRPPLSSSAVPITSAEYQVFTARGAEAYPVPREATLEEIKQAIADYAAAAKAAVHDAGFDGVEIHGANGYLIDQFTKDSVNRRTDAYGGCIENRCRFALEVVRAVVDAVGADRVGLRLSPFTSFLDASDSTPYATFTYLVEQLNSFGLAYLHMVEPRIQGIVEQETTDSLEPFRRVYRGTFMAAGGFTAANGAQAVASGQADLVAYGRWYLANPDLHKRFLLGAPLNKYDRDTFYGGGLKGYTDYPTLEEVKSGKSDWPQVAH